MGLHDLKARELQVEEIVNPNADNLTPFDMLVKYGKFKYNQANNFTNPRDIPDLGEVMYQIGLAGGLTKKVINKLGSDVDGSGNLDLSLETGIPANANYTVYINGFAGLQAIGYDENGMIMLGFSVAPTDTIKIIFI